MSRLVVTGGNHHRLHEELTEAGGYLRDAGFRREERVTEVRRWLEESHPAALSDATFDALRTRFDKQRDSILAAVEARSKDRLRFLVNGEQGYVKCPHERGWPLPFANCVKLRIRGNAWKWAGVVGDSPWLIRELEDESFPSASFPSRTPIDAT